MSVDKSNSRPVSVPELLRQYLKIGSRVLSFNVDESFGHCIDCLTLDDLCETPDDILEKYMNAIGLIRVRDYQSNSSLVKSSRSFNRT
jgi:hypothetical protein